MELIFFVIGLVWIVSSCQFIKNNIHKTLYGLNGDNLYKNLLSERPERYGKDLTKTEKFWRIFFVIILGLVYILGGTFLMFVSLSNLHTWLPK